MQDYLEKTELFDKDEIEYFLSFGKNSTLPKGKFYITEGDIAKKFAFVKSGLLRSFYYSSNSEEVTYCFSFPGELMAGFALTKGEFLSFAYPPGSPLIGPVNKVIQDMLNDGSLDVICQKWLLRDCSTTE